MLNKSHFKQSINIALPMVLSQIVITMNNFGSTIMLSHLGHNVLAASALLFAVSTSIIVIVISVLFSSSLLISRLYGAKHYSDIGKLVQQAWLLGIGLSLIVIAIYLNIKPLLLLLGQKSSLVTIIQPYFKYAIFSIPPMFLNVTTKNLCYATNKQRYALYSSIVNVTLSLSLGYVLIFGKFGLPAYGVAGWGIAISLANWISSSLLTILVASTKDMKKYKLFNRHSHHGLEYLKKLFVIGWPMSVQMAAELLSLFVITMMVGLMSNIDLAAMQITMQYMLFLLIPVMGFANATGVLVGQSYGRNQFNEINKLFLANLLLGIGFLIIVICLYIIFHHAFINLFLKPNQPDYQKIFSLTYIVFLIRFVGLFFDSIKNIVTGGLRGLLDTRYPMFIAILSIWIIYIPLAYIMGFVVQFGLIGITSSDVVAMIIGASLLIYRWRKKMHSMTTTNS